MNKTTKGWLLKVADFVEQFPSMPKEDVASLSVDHPAKAAAHAVSFVPAEERTAVGDLIRSIVLSADFSVAAQEIRGIADSGPVIGR